MSSNPDTVQAPAGNERTTTPASKSEPDAPAPRRKPPPQAPVAAHPVKVTVSASNRHLSPATSARSLPSLTRRQHELLDYLRRRAESGQRPASLTEICRDLGLASRGSLHKQVVALVHAGLAEPMNGKQRGVRLIEAANDADGVIPLLGAIAAGRPIEALTRDETVQVPPWLRVAADCYALRVRGESMRDVGILDGDVVVVEARGHARNGEMVVALVDGAEATLKRIEQRAGEVVLHAENTAFQPQRYAPDRVRIQGVVVAALRRY
jgi:repressor LexA